MPQENFLPANRIVAAGDMSADVTSPAVEVKYLDNVCFQCIWSDGSSPVGVVLLQGSVNYGVAGQTAAWQDITLSATLSVSGASGNLLVDANQSPFPYLRVVYDRTSGSGNLDVWVSGKES